MLRHMWIPNNTSLRKFVLEIFLYHSASGQKKLAPMGMETSDSSKQWGQFMWAFISTPGSFSSICFLSAREYLVGIFCINIWILVLSEMSLTATICLWYLVVINWSAVNPCFFFLSWRSWIFYIFFKILYKGFYLIIKVM